MENFTFVGDVHGAASDLRVLLTDPVVAASRLIFLGDYIDGRTTRRFSDHVESVLRDPLGVLTLIKERVTQHGDVALLGNHDDFWLQTARRDDLTYQTWKINHGVQTWRQLGIHSTRLNRVSAALNHEPLRQFTEFLAQCPLTWETDHLFAVHAGIDWHRSVNDQCRDDLLWIRGDYYFRDDAHRDLGWHPNDLGKVMVTGHTPVQTLQGPGKAGYLKLQANDHDVPRYLIDAGSHTDAYDGGVLALTLTPGGQLVQAVRAVKQRLYSGTQPLSEAMVNQRGGMA
ncbi:metallophosphoesterase [Levilactobacillus acidifarinae]|uniref:Diadenosine tetraphosphatase-like protein n=1 Tax=Levilactobacillus acidifarinae DSM 19394 = JCM 15949 TaxID=1423715 RepID=A0A0R1LKI8_9LACO|nr:metallophosphoesterase [Levilactobacillus acidifarinae]KRK96335.1 diadenosine tetraphosphatase-like protein [Levilactobacillus acidifarinae DSM 19394]GEO69081.1 serine/threonine protein phosphatase [Levilactobacillus acidifarinae]